jgi:hypothetical protein
MNHLELCALLALHGMSKRGTAAALDINERTMRAYCSGKARIPTVVALAVRCLTLDATPVAAPIPAKTLAAVTKSTPLPVGNLEDYFKPKK